MAVTVEQVWERLKECYDPEIPCNVVDLGLVYDVQLTPAGGADEQRVDVKMTLTAQGCPMSGMISAEVQQKLLGLAGVAEANVQIVFDPPWNPSLISEDGRKKLGLV